MKDNNSNSMLFILLEDNRLFLTITEDHKDKDNRMIDFFERINIRLLTLVMKQIKANETKYQEHE